NGCQSAADIVRKHSSQHRCGCGAYSRAPYCQLQQGRSRIWRRRGGSTASTRLRLIDELAAECRHSAPACLEIETRSLDGCPRLDKQSMTDVLQRAGERFNADGSSD